MYILVYLQICIDYIISGWFIQSYAQLIQVPTATSTQPNTHVDLITVMHWIFFRTIAIFRLASNTYRLVDLHLCTFHIRIDNIYHCHTGSFSVMHRLCQNRQQLPLPDYWLVYLQLHTGYVTIESNIHPSNLYSLVYLQLYIYYMWIQMIMTQSLFTQVCFLLFWKVDAILQ